MRLTQFTDYALRTVIYLGGNPGRLVPVNEVARSYGISYHHLTKVAGRLNEIAVVEAVRGRSGGLRLARPTTEINIGWLVRQTENDFHLVECFDSNTDSCPITAACMLRGVLQDAMQQFLGVLDDYSLADFLAEPKRRDELVQLWHAASSSDGAPLRRSTTPFAS